MNSCSYFRMKRVIKILILSLLLILFSLWGVYIFISSYAKPFIYTDIEKVPLRDVGLVLGTSPYMYGGERNIFFDGRIEAARALYEKWKIRHILVSGDNSTPSYNEPNEMKKALVKAGIPEEKITQDFAGFRTLDSVIRAKVIFGQNQFIIISQGFHNERAIYLAHENGIDAIAFNAASIKLSLSPMTYAREVIARVLALYDAHFDTDATILWQQEIIDI